MFQFNPHVPKRISDQKLVTLWELVNTKRSALTRIQSAVSEGETNVDPGKKEKD